MKEKISCWVLSIVAFVGCLIGFIFCLVNHYEEWWTFIYWVAVLILLWLVYYGMYRHEKKLKEKNNAKE